ncbi:hypothetical protein PILCRDRAFT_453770 [Piloderma croceum F 1598]|uniref:Uncharacterized protein n=1 Tax=Piloderma croceum (strain F 1598) TaxID=765440 RepID=A0A0C3FVX5_PILCF|nr:hypothetical protein PILCRDRAFT_453770 [Piloderma croceum F 1598]
MLKCRTLNFPASTPNSMTSGAWDATYYRTSMALHFPRDALQTARMRFSWFSCIIIMKFETVVFTDSQPSSKTSRLGVGP